MVETAGAIQRTLGALKSGKKIVRRELAHLLAPLSYPIYGGQGTIVLLHQVLPQMMLPRRRFGWVKDIQHSVEFIEWMVHWFLKKGYEPISMDDVETRLRGQSGRRFVVFTVDDGFLDAYLYIRPLFQKYSIPWTFFICTEFMERTALLDAHWLEKRMLENTSPFSVEMPDGTVKTLSRSDPKACDLVIREISSLDAALGRKGFSQWCHRQFGKQNLEDFAASMCCSWDQIREMSLDGNITIGSHGLSHVHLPQLSDEELHNEVYGSRKVIEAQIDKPVHHFCYPFGATTKKVCAAVKDAGYRTAASTIYGNLFAQNADYPHALPRIYWQTSSHRRFYTAVSGVDAALANRGTRMFNFERGIR